MYQLILFGILLCITVSIMFKSKKRLRWIFEQRLYTPLAVQSNQNNNEDGRWGQTRPPPLPLDRFSTGRCP